MTRLTRDEHLEQLVRELNERDERSGAPELPPASVPEGNPLERLLVEMTQRGASDLLLIAGNPPILRVGGRLVRTEGDVLDGSDVAGLFHGFIGSRMRAKIEDDGAADFSLRLASAVSDDDRRARRFRVNVHHQRGTLAAAIRSLPTEVPTLAQLNLPPSLAEMVKPTRGLVLVCGPTGAGKTTTLAAMVGELNRIEARHVVTIEDPIEYEHRNSKSVIEQVEVGAMLLLLPRRFGPPCDGSRRDPRRRDARSGDVRSLSPPPRPAT